MTADSPRWRSPGAPPVRPQVSPVDAERIVAEVWGGTVASVDDLVGEWDRNFRVALADGSLCVLKVAAASPAPVEERTPPEVSPELALQHTMMAAVADGGAVRCPRTIPTSEGGIHAEVVIAGNRHRVRLLTWVGGRPLASVNPPTRPLLRRLGAAAAEVSRSLAPIDAGAAPDDFMWDLRRGADTVAGLAAAIPDPARRRLATELADRSARRLAPLWAHLDVGLIHGDLNDHNILVDGDAPVGVIDFGDAHRSVRIAEAAIPAAYAALGLADPVEAIADVATGFHAVRPLDEHEVAAVTPLAVLRLCLSVTISAHQAHAYPDNPYLRISEDQAWDTLHHLAATTLPLAEMRVRHACGLEPAAHGPAVAAWLADHGARLHGVLDIPMTEDSVCRVDWSVTSPDAEHPDIAAPMAQQARQVARTMADSGASVGVGRQGEPRIVYAAPEFAVATNRGRGWRTVHLGVDLSCPAGTEVRALCDGTVFRIDDDAVDRGYGSVVTLRHDPGDGPSFFTLYGHLARRSVVHLRPGDHVPGERRVGAVGAPDENGGWVPHLHFQVMADDLDIDGPFPGVALADEWAVWASVCPSPRDALRLPSAVVDFPPPDDDTVTHHHRDLLPPSQSVSYARPLVAVRGHGPWLYDTWGRGHLDAVNNVAHVGHQHPHVVAAQRRQVGLIDTNTRYPHPERIRYMGRLAEMFPAPLDTVYLVSSGSEANELALRIARTVTGGDGVLVLDGAYHGNTTTLVDVSPYKHDGPGGRGAPPWVHRLPLPDVYRNPETTDLALHREAARHAVGACGGGPAVLLVESMPSVAGQIELPDGYLDTVFSEVRRAGGLCIADEVQVGLGRIGSHWWAFQRQGVVPDIVTLGKPLGNGYPMAAVVTTAAIADAFANGMEYFNTFGGNPVACAVGNAVLDVMVDEGLRDNAAAVGSALRRDLDDLATRHHLIGDVRGAGLFLGVELVVDRRERSPATDQAAYVVERCRELGVLLAVDGPHRNVLKIKPPLVFGPEHAGLLLETLDRVLAEDDAQPGQLVSHQSP